MTAGPRILLTNDDGIDAPGLRALRDRLQEVGTVDVFAPRENQSAIGRALTYGRTGGAGSLNLTVDEGEFSCRVPHEDHDLGYAIDGTPCDCVIVGLNVLDPPPDVVVAGCNPGANVGAYVLSRSGTVSAAMEAAMLGTPAMAVSVDVIGHQEPLREPDYATATDVTAELLETAVDSSVFEEVDYLNVNAPSPDRPVDGIAVTRPTPVYEMDAAVDGDEFRLYNRLWEQMASGSLPDDEGTDRSAVLSGSVSVSPLRAPVEPATHPAIERLAARYAP